MDTSAAQADPADPRQRSWRITGPRQWGIATRSAAVSAAVVLVALTIAAIGLLAVLQGSLLSGVDDAARTRVGDIAEDLLSTPPTGLDDNLFATNQSIAAVQIADADGNVVRHSPGAPVTALGTVSSTTPTVATPPLHDGMRISGQTVNGRGGRYTVLVGGSTEAVSASTKTVALLLAVAAPLVMAETASVSYLLTKRSLSSVDAIRSRVADISTSDLSERVPVPASRDEIAALALTMNEMLDRIEKGHRAQRQFVGDASHELRSPLTTILSALEVADAHPQLLNRALITETLLPEANRMKVLIEDLLLLARADEATLVPRRDVVHIGEIVADESARIRHRSSLQVQESHEDTDASTLLGDPAGLSRMVRNLLDNAARHARTRIEVGTHVRSGCAAITIADDGPGIAPAERERVFDRFVRLETDRSRRSGGTGLGLAIVAEIVAAHQGTVIVGERAGGGTLVTVTLPSGQ
ncbi:MAG TPA: HAMP domain-containing sensor histidine kinase [Mycobacterium sp.]|nr:HAMP domain-containing sensor histidine kinase [Mycobacterium sp.]